MKSERKAKKKRGLLVVLTGPSGVGKNSLIDALKADDPTLFHSISMTTREPRKGEVHGVSYHFTSKEDFRALIEAGEVLEFDIYLDEYYGTPKATIVEKTENEVDVLLDLTVRGALELKENYPDAILIFISAPSEKALRDRLLARGTETPERIEQRLKTAQDELNRIQYFDYLVVNGKVEEASSDIQAIIRAEKRRVDRLFVDEEEPKSV